jgi:enamine deaminase RidA (YjgF/YER057c/UK114 family)
VMTTGAISFEESTLKLHVRKAGKSQAFIVALVPDEEDAAKASRTSYRMIADTLIDRRMQIVHERVFGSLGVEAAVLRERKTALSERQISADGPVTYVEGTPPWGEGLAGIIIHAVSRDSADDIWTIMDGETPCGWGWKRNGSTCLMLQNINGWPDAPTENEGRRFQVRRMLDRAEKILRENNASYGDVARTWFYLSDILDWYAAFNKVRNEKYGEFGIMPGPGDTRLLLPASTGIGAHMPSGEAASMDLLAVVDDSKIKQLSNRKQLDAFRYGAAFSRGAVIEEDDVKIIQISGTAAIDEHGVSLYPGDICAQINCTFDRLETLLEQEGATLSDICAATVFVKLPEYAEVFWKMADERGLADFPAVCVVADVCREELLFEIDAEAVVRKIKGSRDHGAE